MGKLKLNELKEGDQFKFIPHQDFKKAGVEETFMTANKSYIATVVDEVDFNDEITIIFKNDLNEDHYIGSSFIEDNCEIKLSLKEKTLAKCKFGVVYVGKYVPYQKECGNKVVGSDEYCKSHKGIKCVRCGEQASSQCSYAGQFECGWPLCDSKECHEEHHIKAHVYIGL